MSSDLLSQDDIDNIIQQEKSGSDEGGGSGADGVDAESLKQPLSVVSEQMSTVLLTVLGKEISVSTDSLAAADENKLNEQFGADSVIIKVDLSDAVNGPLHFIYKKEDVAVLADLMMMGDGSASYEEDHKDAIVELTNQIMGAVTSTFGTTFEVQVAAAGASIEDFSPTADVDYSGAFCAGMTMKVEDVKEIPLAVVVPGATASDMAAVASKGGAAASDAGGGGGDEAGFDLGDLGGEGVQGMPMQNFNQPSGQVANDNSSQFNATGNPQIDMLLDVTLQVAIELGRTEMSIKRILELGPGSIIELDRMAGEPVDLLVNDKVIAKGEVVVVDENFGVRIVKLVSPEERLKNLK